MVQYNHPLRISLRSNASCGERWCGWFLYAFHNFLLLLLLLFCFDDAKISKPFLIGRVMHGNEMNWDISNIKLTARTRKTKIVNLILWLASRWTAQDKYKPNLELRLATRVVWSCIFLQVWSSLRYAFEPTQQSIIINFNLGPVNKNSFSMMRFPRPH
jgi:hypothetical protein